MFSDACDKNKENGIAVDCQISCMLSVIDNGCPNQGHSHCLVNGTFFLVTSSFHVFPGLPIYASTDLKKWTQVGELSPSAPNGSFRSVLTLDLNLIFLNRSRSLT